MTTQEILAKYSLELPAVVAAKHEGKRNGWRYRLRTALVEAGMDYNEAHHIALALLKEAQGAK